MKDAPTMESAEEDFNELFDDALQLSTSDTYAPLFEDRDLAAAVAADMVPSDPKILLRVSSVQPCDASVHEAAAVVIEGTGDYRVLRRVRPRAICPAYRLVPGEAVAVIVDDCHALLELLASSSGDGDPALHYLIASSGQARVRLWAEGSPFDRKDAQRSRGYRWNNGDDGRSRSWWTEIPRDALDDEVRFLGEEIYRRSVDLPREMVTAHERYRAG